jgi:hypothetical protein
MFIIITAFLLLQNVLASENEEDKKFITSPMDLFTNNLSSTKFVNVKSELELHSFSQNIDFLNESQINMPSPYHSIF